MTTLTPTADYQTQTDETYDPFWRISVQKYHEMIEAGVLTEDDRLELVEGWLIKKMSVKPAHSFVTDQLRDELADILPRDYFVKSQQPVTTVDSEPEPDVLVVCGHKRTFINRHPGPDDVPLIAEVSDSTLDRDQTWKKRVYARAGFPVYWIVNLVDRQIEVYTNPTGEAQYPNYRQLQSYDESGVVPVMLDGREVAQLSVRELLP